MLPVAAVLGVAVVAASTLIGASPATAVVGVGANQEIRNQQTTLCLDDFAFNTQPGAEVKQWTCLEGPNQVWEIKDVGGGAAEVKNKYSNLCLDVPSAASAGSEIRQWTCNGSESQRWQMVDVNGFWTTFQSQSNGLCLEANAAPTDGSAVVLNGCNQSSTQNWRITDPNVAKLTYTLGQSSNPTPDEADAYARIAEAMDRAVARYNKHNNTQRHLWVEYAPWVQTADATIMGNIRFGANRGFMQEGVALHEIAHTVGVGTAWNFQGKVDAQDWPAALPLLRSWDGPEARINGGGGHMWPYGLNYAGEYNEIAFERNVKLIQAMHHDGL